MSGARSDIEAVERNEKCGSSAIVAHPANWSMKATSRPPRAPKIEAILLAIAGDDLRQPLEAIESAHKLLSLGVRTNSELRWLRSGQSAISRLKEQLRKIQTALHVRELATQLEPRPVRIQSDFAAGPLRARTCSLEQRHKHARRSKRCVDTERRSAPRRRAAQFGRQCDQIHSTWWPHTYWLQALRREYSN